MLEHAVRALVVGHRPRPGARRELGQIQKRRREGRAGARVGGCREVRGVAELQCCDIDPPSVAAARELLPGARVEFGTAERLAPCEQVVANMTGQELLGSLSAVCSLWRGPAPLVLSGMRAHEVDELVAAVAAPVQDRVTVGAFTAVAFRAGRRG